jgi:hypothetical protein
MTMRAKKAIARFELHVAPGHVQAHGIAVHVFERFFDRDVGAALGDRHHQFDLVVEVGRLRRIQDACPGALDRHRGIGRLHEEERRFAVRIAAHFARLGGVVAADAEDAVDREAFFVAGDGEGMQRCGWYGVFHVCLQDGVCVVLVRERFSRAFPRATDRACAASAGPKN